MKNVLLTIIFVALLVSLVMNFYLLSEGDITGEVVANYSEFEVYTEAVCDVEGCHDELFIVCGNTETSLGNVVGSEIEIDEEWEDPRE
jgi:hypothetical protein